MRKMRPETFASYSLSLNEVHFFKRRKSFSAECSDFKSKCHAPEAGKTKNKRVTPVVA